MGELTKNELETLQAILLLEVEDVEEYLENAEDDEEKEDLKGYLEEVKTILLKISK